MLFLHETHRVVGSRAEDFEAAFRDAWMPALAKENDARLLWYLNQAHGTGPSYTVVTITALRDGDAWERHSQRTETGDMRAPAAELDEMRHEAQSKLLAPVSWSSLQEVGLEDVPSGDVDRPPALYMEDTVWPYPGALEDYLCAAGTLYAHDTIAKRMAEGTSLLDLRAAFRTVAGSRADSEVVLWQRVIRPELLVRLLTQEIPAEHRGPGTWMREALAYRDRWESRLLRTAAWSPLD